MRCEEALLEAVAAGPGGPARIKEVAEGAPVGALADAIGELPVEAMRQVLSALGPERLAEVIAEVDPQTAAEVLLRLTRPEAADVLDEMDPDDAADVIGELRDEDAPAAEQLLQEMEPEEAADVRQLLTYPEDTAGGIMTTDFISVPATDTVGQVVRRVRAPGADDVPEESASYVYVTEPGGQLAGVVPWHRLVRAGERVPVRSLISPQVVSVPASADQETVARVVRDYRLLAVPVVDEQGALLGIVTADDVAEVEEEEATEDIERLSGAQPLDEPYLRAGPFRLARKRVLWLLLLFLGATYTGTVLQHFQGQLDAVVALSFFIPMLIGTGGNAGSQTVMTVIRALSVGEISSRDVAAGVAQGGHHRADPGHRAGRRGGGAGPPAGRGDAHRAGRGPLRGGHHPLVGHGGGGAAPAPAPPADRPCGRLRAPDHHPGRRDGAVHLPQRGHPPAHASEL